ncbi:hypothetical protein ABVT39_022573 [Epinephelus coioides]
MVEKAEENCGEERQDNRKRGVKLKKGTSGEGKIIPTTVVHCSCDTCIHGDLDVYCANSGCWASTLTAKSEDTLRRFELKHCMTHTKMFSRSLEDNKLMQYTAVERRWKE